MIDKRGSLSDAQTSHFQIGNSKSQQVFFQKLASRACFRDSPPQMNAKELHGICSRELELIVIVLSEYSTVRYRTQANYTILPMGM